jgi:hypothetical protein
LIGEIGYSNSFSAKTRSARSHKKKKNTSLATLVFTMVFHRGEGLSVLNCFFLMVRSRVNGLPRLSAFPSSLTSKAPSATMAKVDTAAILELSKWPTAQKLVARASEFLNEVQDL